MANQCVKHSSTSPSYCLTLALGFKRNWKYLFTYLLGVFSVSFFTLQLTVIGGLDDNSKLEKSPYVAVEGTRDEQEIAWGQQILRDPSTFAKTHPGNCQAKRDRSRDGANRNPISAYRRVLVREQFNLVEHGSAEAWLERSFLPSINSTGLFFVDVGANTGQFAIPITKMGHKVISFEPVPSTCAILRANLAKAGLTSTVYCKAASDKISTVNFLTKKGAPTASFKQVEGVSTKIPVSDVSEISTTTLDSVIPNKETILFLKTDTQGYELSVLQGARQLFVSGRVKLVAVEFSYGLLEAAGTDPLDILNFLADFNYVCTYLGWHTKIKAGTPGKYGVPQNMPPIQAKSISFEDLVELVRVFPVEVGGIGTSGWTDLLCWQSC